MFEGAHHANSIFIFAAECISCVHGITLYSVIFLVFFILYYFTSIVDIFN